MLRILVYISLCLGHRALAIAIVKFRSSSESTQPFRTGRERNQTKVRGWNGIRPTSWHSRSGSRCRVPRASWSPEHRMFYLRLTWSVA